MNRHKTAIRRRWLRVAALLTVGTLTAAYQAAMWAEEKAGGMTHKPAMQSHQMQQAPGAHGMAAMPANRPKFEPATVCKTCHEKIYNDWSQSMHAHAREAWYFSHKVASERFGMTCNNEQGKAIACDTCHEPAGVYPFGAVMQKKPPAMAAAEGVTCDVCHRITEVKGTGDFSFGPREVKLGPYGDAESPYHKTRYSPLHETEDFCVACHGQLSNLNGLVVCDTVRAWRESRYAKEGETCQSCHMPSATGAAADGVAAPKDAPKNRTLHSHRFRGPHNDPSLLREAATLEQQVTPTDQGGLQVHVAVTNSGTGHDMPSGLPERLIVLRVTAKNQSGDVVWQNWKDDVYAEDRQAAFGLFGFNATGAEVPPMGAARIDRLSLMPEETRRLEYRLSPEQADAVASVEARLVYHAARPDGIAYFGNFWLPTVEPKLMAEAVTDIR